MGNRIVFVDEFGFGKNTVLTKSWSSLKQSVFYPKTKRQGKCQILVLGVSAEHGVEGFTIYERSVKSNDFLNAILTYRTNGTRYTVFGDNARYHTSHETFRGL